MCKEIVVWENRAYAEKLFKNQEQNSRNWNKDFFCRVLEEGTHSHMSHKENNDDKLTGHYGLETKRANQTLRSWAIGGMSPNTDEDWLQMPISGADLKFQLEIKSTNKERMNGNVISSLHAVGVIDIDYLKPALLCMHKMRNRFNNFELRQRKCLTKL